MKTRTLVVAALATLGTACSTTTEKHGLSFRVEPVETVRHGGPNAQSYYQLGRYFQGQQRMSQAEEAYRKAIALDDRYLDAFNALASVYAQRGETERAAKMLEKLTAIVPEAAYLHNNLGYAYYLMGRQEEAYACVKKALSLDATLERGWANLGLIAAGSGGAVLTDAARARKLEALPAALGIPQQPAAEAQPLQAAAEPGFALAAPASAAPPVDRIRAKARDADALPQEVREGGGTFNGRFAVFTAREERVANDQPLYIAMPTAANVPVSLMPSFRVEVSNGNGVARFANRFSAMLRSNDIAVTRITNSATFSMSRTLVEYQPGYDGAAKALLARINLEAQLVPATRARAGVDIRVVLGRDAALACTSACSGKGAGSRMVLSRPAPVEI